MTSTSIISNQILLLGMVFAEENIPKRGQEFRDRVRCESLEKLGFIVKTLDDKHDDMEISHNKHCRASFTDTRRMLRIMRKKWGCLSFQYICLDYFFSPVGWARIRWSSTLYTETLPMLATNGYLIEGGEIWLPHLECTNSAIIEHQLILSKYYSWRFESNLKLNPLWTATNNVNTELLKCPANMTNETQMKTYHDYSNEPFIVLTFQQNDKFHLDNLDDNNKLDTDINVDLSLKKRKRNFIDNTLKSPVMSIKTKIQPMKSKTTVDNEK